MMYWTDTLDALHAGVCAAPKDTTAKLVFADCCEESDDSTLHQWAQLIRRQTRVSELGPPPFTIEDFDTLRFKGGPDCYQVFVGHGYPFAVGERVNVTRRGSALRNFWSLDHIFKHENTLHNLRIVKVEADGVDGRLLTLTRDEYSIPYPVEEAARLTKEAAELIAAAPILAFTHPEFCSRLDEVVTLSAHHVRIAHQKPRVRTWEYRDGFVTSLVIPWARFASSTTSLTTLAPLQRVALTTPPVLEIKAHDDGRSLVMSLAGLPTTPAYTVPVGYDMLEVARVLLARAWPTVSEWVLP